MRRAVKTAYTASAECERIEAPKTREFQCGGVWGGVPLLQTTRRSGERRELPSGRSPGRKRILAYFESHTFCTYTGLTEIFGGKAEVGEGGGSCPLPQRRTAPAWDDLRKIFPGCQLRMAKVGTKCRRKLAEYYNRRALQMTDRRQTDGRQQLANVNVSSRSLIKWSTPVYYTIR